jgi:branched-chain amino acid transport system substrate-binding protein
VSASTGGTAAEHRRRFMRRLTPFLVVVALALAGCGGGSSGTSDSGPIKVGLIVSLTGNYTPLGSEDRNAVNLAVKQINDAGGVLGRQLQVITRDDQTKPDQSVLAFNDLKGQGIVAVLGSSFSNSGLATIPLAEREKIPYISLAAADQQVEPIRKYAFMSPARATLYAERLLQYYQGVGMTKVAVAYDTKSAFATSGYKATVRLAPKYGVQLVANEQFETTTSDFSATFTHVRDSGAQALEVWATGAPGVTVTKQFATSGLKMKLVLTGAEASVLWSRPSGPAAEGVILDSSIGVVGPHVPDSPLKQKIAAFAGPYQQQYGHYPPQFAFDGVAAVQLLTEAIKKAGGTDRDKIRDALEGLTLVTPNGEYRYSPTDHSGLSTDFIAVVEVKNGQFVPTAWGQQQLAKVAS